MLERRIGLKGYTMLLTAEGCGQVRIGTTEHRGEPGKLMLIPAEQAHRLTLGPGQSHWLFHWIYFCPRGFWAPWLNWRAHTSGAAVGRPLGQVDVSGTESQQEFEQLFQKIATVLHQARSSSEHLAMNLLEQLLILCDEVRPDACSRALDPRVRSACQFISDHIDKDFGLEEIARHICLSPSRLAHLFQQHIGISIVRWREDQRVMLAKQLLRGPGLPISSIAAQVGYQDQVYFSRVFRKRVGLSPTEFRNGGATRRLGWGLQA